MISFRVFLDGEGAFKDIPQERVVEGALTHAACLANGTKSGRPSVSFLIEMPDGSYVLTQTTARLLVSLSKMIEAKWPGVLDGN